MSLDSSTSLGKVETEKQILPNLKVRLRTLNSREYAHVMKYAKDLTGSLQQPSMETLGKLVDVQIETLAHATVAINGQEYSGSDKYAKLKDYYDQLQHPVLMEVYRVYLDLLSQQDDIMAELKKNLTTPLSETTT